MGTRGGTLFTLHSIELHFALYFCSNYVCDAKNFAKMNVERWANKSVANGKKHTKANGKHSSAIVVARFNFYRNKNKSRDKEKKDKSIEFRMGGLKTNIDRRSMFDDMKCVIRVRNGNAACSRRHCRRRRHCHCHLTHTLTQPHNKHIDTDLLSLYHSYWSSIHEK